MKRLETADISQLFNILIRGNSDERDDAFTQIITRYDGMEIIDYAIAAYRVKGNLIHISLAESLLEAMGATHLLSDLKSEFLKVDKSHPEITVTKDENNPGQMNIKIYLPTELSLTVSRGIYLESIIDALERFYASQEELNSDSQS